MLWSSEPAHSLFMNGGTGPRAFGSYTENVLECGVSAAKRRRMAVENVITGTAAKVGEGDVRWRVWTVGDVPYGSWIGGCRRSHDAHSKE